MRSAWAHGRTDQIDGLDNPRVFAWKVLVWQHAMHKGVRGRTLQAIAINLWELDRGLGDLVDSGGLEEPQPRARGVMRNQVESMAQFRFDRTSV